MKETSHYVIMGQEFKHRTKEMEEWCLKNIGPGKEIRVWPLPLGILNNILWYMQPDLLNYNLTRFAFEDPKHLTLFLLRWSS